MRDNKIVIYDYPNREIKSFLTPEEIFPPRVGYIKRPLDKDSEETLRSLGVIGGQAVKDIMAIEGVMEIRVKPNEIRMKKEESSSWDDIEGKVLEILIRAVRRKKIRVV